MRIGFFYFGDGWGPGENIWRLSWADSALEELGVGAGGWRSWVWGREGGGVVFGGFF